MERRLNRIKEKDESQILIGVRLGQAKNACCDFKSKLNKFRVCHFQMKRGKKQNAKK